MGDPKIEFFSRDRTFVLWNLEDYPIPVDADLSSFRRNIEEAFDRMGFCGMKMIELFGDHNHNIDDLWKAGLMYAAEVSGGIESAVFQMPLKLIYGARIPSNLAVITKLSQGSELHRVLQCLQSRNHTALVLEPPDETTAQASLFYSVESVVDSTQFLGGGKPIRKSFESFDFYTDPHNEENASSHDLLHEGKDLEEDLSNIKEDFSKIEDFSKPFIPFLRPRTILFWDVVDCPFPLGSSPDSIYHKIHDALHERGCIDELSIWAYVDENNGSWRDEYLREKTWETKIYFLPGGASRRNRMFNDMLLWAFVDSDSDHLDYIHVPVTVIVVSDQFKDDTFFYPMLKNLGGDWDTVVLVTPTQDGNKQESSKWPGLLLDEAHFVTTHKQEIPKGPELLLDEAQAVTPHKQESPEWSDKAHVFRSPKRLKVDAAGETPEGWGDQG